jgi:predicted site-specific integrase-resolvase
MSADKQKKNWGAEEIAARYGVARSTVNQWLQHGKINCVRVKVGMACRRYVTIDDLKAFEKKYDLTPVSE